MANWRLSAIRRQVQGLARSAWLGGGSGFCGGSGFSVGPAPAAACVLARLPPALHGSAARRLPPGADQAGTATSEQAPSGPGPRQHTHGSRSGAGPEAYCGSPSVCRECIWAPRPGFPVTTTRFPGSVITPPPFLEGDPATGGLLDTSSPENASILVTICRGHSKVLGVWVRPGTPRHGRHKSGLEGG